MFGGPRGQFEECYTALSAESLPAETPHRDALVHGNKLVLPASALDRLSRLHVAYPLLFSLRAYSGGGGQPTHCGVLEFSAPEGVLYASPCVLRTIGVAPGGLVRVASAALPRASFVRLQPLRASFATEITDARAVLERALRSYAALTVGDVVSFAYNGDVHELRVLQTQAGGATADAPGTGGMCILETDLQVDFAPHEGAEEPGVESTPPAGQSAGAKPLIGKPAVLRVPKGGVVFASAPEQPAGAAPAPTDKAADAQPPKPAFVPFSGRGNRLV